MECHSNYSKEHAHASVGLNVKIVESSAAKQDIELSYQPQFSLRNQKTIVGLDCQLSLKYPGIGSVPFYSFKPYLESFDVLIALYDSVIQEVYRAFFEFAKNNSLRISIPLPISFICRENAASSLDQMFSNYSNFIPHILFCVDLRRTIADDQLLESLLKLQIRGYHFSALINSRDESFPQQLTTFPFNSIRLDGEKVFHIGQYATHQASARSVLFLAEEWGAQVFVDKVHERADALWLKSVGFHHVQGDLFSRPLSNTELISLIKNGTEFNRSNYVSEKLKLLIIESEVHYQFLLRETLHNQFQIKAVNSWGEAKDFFSTESADVVVLDLGSRGEGQEFLSWLSKLKNIEPPSIVSVSNDQSLKNKLEAYSFGVSDYIEKPYVISELIGKMTRICAYHGQRRSLSEEKLQSDNVAMNSMQEAAFYGDLVKFNSRLIKCADERSLSKLFFKFMEKKGLHCSIQFSSWEHSVSFDHKDDMCSPIEANVFSLLHDKGRIYEFGNRAIVNDNHVSFLVKNMPTDEEAKGRIRDYIVVVIESLEARFHDLLKHRALQSVFHQLSNLTEGLVKAIGDGGKENVELEKFSTDLEMSFHVLNLDEEQEKYLTKIIEQMLKARDENQVDVSDLSAKLSALTSSIEYLLAEDLDEDEMLDEKNSDGGIELF